LGSLALTLDLLSNPQRDFGMWNERAGGRVTPKVAAIVMTMVGSKSKLRATPDRASIMYVERALFRLLRTFKSYSIVTIRPTPSLLLMTLCQPAVFLELRVFQSRG
jgi:hypothetical protein